MTAVLSLEGLSKRYGSVQAVQGVSLAFEPGRIHAVAGENGAGKSTLLKMAAGLVQPDQGVVRVEGDVLAPHSARVAIRRGIGMVQQHFALVDVLSALENVMLGAEPVGVLGRLDLAAARVRAEAVARSLGVSVDWDAAVETLGVGDRQRLEIVRALFRDARVLILDEPTAVLTPGEAEALYGTLRQLAEAGRAVVVVTHHLDEIRAHADDVSVLRRGRFVRTHAMRARDAAEVDAILRDVMGDEPPPAPVRGSHALGPVSLEVRDLVKGRALRGATLTVRCGEIVGVAGVEGNGQRELVRVLAGLDRAEGGTVDVRGADGAARPRSVVVVHEDRHAEGLVLDAAVEDNIVLGELERFSRWGIVDAASFAAEARQRMERAAIMPPDPALPARALSGGNQQKIVVGRAVARLDGAAAFVFAQPTRGVDVAAARAIHRAILGVADAGKAVLVISSDLGELRALADRILVLARGRVVAELPPETSEASIGEAMLGRAGAGAA